MRLAEFKKLPPWGPRFLKKIFSSSGEIVFSFEGKDDACFRIFHAEVDIIPALLFDFIWDEEKCWLGLNDSTFFQRHPLLAGLNLSELPREVASALFESVFERLLEGFEQMSTAPCSIDIVSEDSLPSENIDTVVVGFDFDGSNDFFVSGLMWLGPGGLARLTSIFDKLNRENHEIDLSFLPLPVSCNFGRARLSVEEFRSIEKGDIIIMEPGSLDETIVYVTEKPMLRARLDKGKCIVVSAIARNEMEERDIRTEETDSEDLGDKALEEPLIKNSDDLPVDIRFQLGRQLITLAELRSIKPGYVFETALNVEKPVTIIANGVKVGIGEIVDISGKIGVRVTEFLKDAKL